MSQLNLDDGASGSTADRMENLLEEDRIVFEALSGDGDPNLESFENLFARFSDMKGD